MVAVHFPIIPCEPNTVNRHIESNIPGQIRPCINNIGHAKILEVFFVGMVDWEWVWTKFGWDRCSYICIQHCFCPISFSAAPPSEHEPFPFIQLAWPPECCNSMIVIRQHPRRFPFLPFTKSTYQKFASPVKNFIQLVILKD